MKIVIDIDEESYEHIKAYSNEEVLPIGWYAIINGTPLPKGHGRIIDESKINKFYYENEEAIYKNIKVINTLIIGTDAPTIIEAYKEVSNGISD